MQTSTTRRNPVFPLDVGSMIVALSIAMISPGSGNSVICMISAL